MGRIQVLEDGLVNRIAAGEVVERPASVVKELLENSLDAGAGRLDIQVQGGGARVLRVTDDGVGMDRDDALLSLERHATSKLRSSADLDRIRTLGFRGEALPSIAAVSRFLLRTAEREGEGTEIEVRGGRILHVKDAAAARGTSVEVASLFFNTPARRKFLKSEPTELAHVVRVVTRHALARPDVRFRLEQDRRVLVDAPPAKDHGERIEQLFGVELRRRLLRFEASLRGGSILGFAARPADADARRDGQHLFVNGRQIQDRALLHAVSEAYRNTLSQDRFPAVFLFLEVDPSSVDVNVHPQKTEVRFAYARDIHDAVRDGIQGALSGERAVPTYAQLRPSPGEVFAVAEAPRAPSAVREVASAAPATLFEERMPAQIGASERRAVAIAQYLDSYILAQDAEGLLVVDQHAAHERVLFERYLAQVEESRVEVQRLLFPAIVEIPAHERILLDAESEELARLGFAVEPFGDRSVRIDGIPAVADGADPEALLRELVGEAGRTPSAATGIAPLRRRLVTTAACHAAIKIHHPLTTAAMQKLLDDLFRADNPTTCPHGRPILFRFSLEEIERTFRRR